MAGQGPVRRGTAWRGRAGLAGYSSPRGLWHLQHQSGWTSSATTKSKSSSVSGMRQRQYSYDERAEALGGGWGGGVEGGDCEGHAGGDERIDDTAVLGLHICA